MILLIIVFPPEFFGRWPESECRSRKTGRYAAYEIEHHELSVGALRSYLRAVGKYHNVAVVGVAPVHAQDARERATAVEIPDKRQRVLPCRRVIRGVVEHITGGYADRLPAKGIAVIVGAAACVRRITGGVTGHGAGRRVIVRVVALAIAIPSAYLFVGLHASGAGWTQT